MAKLFGIAIAVIAIAGFGISSYVFSENPIQLQDMLKPTNSDKEGYIAKIDKCLKEQTMHEGMSLNSFQMQMAEVFKDKAENAESTAELDEILDNMYQITDCKP